MGALLAYFGLIRASWWLKEQALRSDCLGSNPCSIICLLPVNTGPVALSSCTSGRFFLSTKRESNICHLGFAWRLNGVRSSVWRLTQRCSATVISSIIPLLRIAALPQMTARGSDLVTHAQISRHKHSPASWDGRSHLCAHLPCLSDRTLW